MTVIAFTDRSIVVDGDEYQSADQMPTDVRAAYEEWLTRVDSGVADGTARSLIWALAAIAAVLVSVFVLTLP